MRRCRADEDMRGWGGSRWPAHLQQEHRRCRSQACCWQRRRLAREFALAVEPPLFARSGALKHQLPALLSCLSDRSLRRMELLGAPFANAVNDGVPHMHASPPNAGSDYFVGVVIQVGPTSALGSKHPGACWRNTITITSTVSLTLLARPLGVLGPAAHETHMLL